MDIDQEHSHFDTASALVSGNHYLPDTHLKDASFTKCFLVNLHSQAFPAALHPHEQREIIQETPTILFPRPYDFDLELAKNFWKMFKSDT